MAFQLTTLRTRVARRILGLFVLCAIVPIVTLAVLSYRRVRTQLIEQTGLWLGQLSKETGINVLKRLSEIDDQLRATAKDIADGRPPLLRAAAQPPDAEPRRWIAGLMLASPDAPRRSILGTSESPPRLGPDAARDLAAGRSVLVTTSPTRFWLARAVEARAPRQIVWASIDAPALLSIDRTSEVLPVGAVMCILDFQRRPLYCPDGVPPPLSQRTRRVTSSRTVLTWQRGGTEYLTSPWELFLRGRFSAAPLTVAVSEPATAVLDSMAAFHRTFPLVVLLTVLFAMALGYTLIRRSTEPLAQLQEGTRRLAALDFSQPVRVRSGDEFEDLAESFNAMAERVQRARASLQESETRLRTIMDTAPLGVLTVDAAGTIEYANATTERLFGRPHDELVGQNVAVLVSDPALGAVFRQPGDSTEIEAHRGDGTVLPIAISVSEVRLGGRTLFTALARDLSEERRAEETRERLEGQLRQSQKLETIGTLAGGIAHDFNNILTALLGYVNLALSEAPPDHQVHRDLVEVQRAGLRAADLARQILVFSQRTEQRRQLVILQEIVEEALRLLRASLPTTIEIRTTIDPDTPLIMADPTQIHQVLMNLCTNAGHAMRSGGVLEVVLSTAAVTPDRTDAAAVLPVGTYARLTVRDTGHGMDRDTQERIFDPFFTTKPAGEGTGLGLSVVHGIVAKLNGAITVESAPDEGTTFTVYFPAAVDTAGPSKEAAPKAEGGREHILVVDDDAAVVAVTARLLARLGYRVTTRRSSPEALDLVRADPAAYDVLLTDQTMPHMTGVQLADAIHRIRPDLPIILTSGLAEAPDIDSRRALGIRELLLKPATPRELGAAVRRAVDDEAVPR